MDIRGYQYIASVIFAAALLCIIGVLGDRVSSFTAVIALAFAWGGAYMGEYSVLHPPARWWAVLCTISAVLFSILAVVGYGLR